MEHFAAWLDAHRRLAGGLVLAVCGLALLGVARLDLHLDIRDLFRADDRRMETLERVSETFGDDDRECLVLVEGSDVFDEASVAVVRRLAAALRARPEVAWVLAPTDVVVLGANGLPRSLLPAPGADATARSRAREAAIRHPLAGGRLVSADGRALLTLVRLREDVDVLRTFAGTDPPLQRTVREATAGTSVRAVLSGVPVVRGELISRLVREQSIFLTLGSVVGGIVCFLLFRSLTAVVVATVAAATGSFWTLGAMGLVGEPINPVNNIVPTVVLMVAYSDAVHLLHAIRRSLRDGATPRDATRRAVATVGPACALTSLTTAIGFASLATARLDVIQRFGVVAAGGAVLGFAAIVTIVPLLAGSRLSARLVPRAADRPRGPEALPRVARLPLVRPRLVAGLGLAATVAMAVVATNLVASTQLREGMPSDGPTARAIAAIDEHFGGVLTLLVLVERPDAPAGTPGLDREFLDVLGAVEAVLVDTGVSSVPLSLLDVLAVLPSGADDPLRAAAGLGLVPPELLRRVRAPDGRSAVVSAPMRDDGTHVQKPVLDAVRAGLAGVEAAHPGFDLTLTGNPVAVGEAAGFMIRDLALSLSIAAGVIALVMALAFRSVLVGLLCVLPNVFPLVVAGALLVAVGHPLTVTAVITFCVCLGIAVDDTIHVIVRLRHELRTDPAPRDPLAATLLHVGGALLITTLVFLGGFGTLTLSGLPMLRTFGALCVAALAAALVGDLVILPALLRVFEDRVRRSLAPARGPTGP